MKYMTRTTHVMAALTVMLCATISVSSQSQASSDISPWAVTSNKLAHGKSILVTETPWAGASFNVTGPKISLWYLANERGGQAMVLLNGKRAKTIDMYSKRTIKKAIPLLGVTGTNIVQVIALPQRNVKAKGQRINVDAFSTSTRSCSINCTTTPTIINVSRGELGDTGTWYPQAVPQTTDEMWPVAIGSYVRNRDATPIAAARSVVRQAACETGRRVKRGVVVLSFGKQVAAGANGFGTAISYSDVAEVSRAWAAGLAECGTGPWEIAIATSNSGGVTNYNGYSGGARWAQLVSEAAATADPRVIVSAGVDLEPGWGPPGQARAWVDGYVAASSKRLWNFGSADGCPQTYLSKLTCNNGWTVDDVIWVSSRAGTQVVAMPQLHTQSGSLARQWAVLAERAVATGAPLRLAAVGVQTAACNQVKGGCPTTGESAWNAWFKLRTLLDARAATRATPLGAPRDIRWGWEGTFVVPQPTTTTSTTTTTTSTTTTTLAPPARITTTTTSTTTSTTAVSTTSAAPTTTATTRPAP